MKAQKFFNVIRNDFLWTQAYFYVEKCLKHKFFHKNLSTFCMRPKYFCVKIKLLSYEQFMGAT